MKYFAILTVFAAWFAFTPATEITGKVDHTAWNNLLQKHVSTSGNVDYAGFRKDKGLLDNYLNALSNNAPQASWSRNEKLAYWINVYNAYTIKLILNNYPVKSIKDLHGGNPWEVKWIKIGGKTYSLNAIENDIIRPQFKEPRIHFAVNCAAKSCPPLLNKAWTAENLEQSLEQQTRKFINDKSFNTINTDGAKVSQIFNWYQQDFGDLKTYLNKYATNKVHAKATVTFREYDWALNGK